MKRKELKAIAREYARAVYRAWTIEEANRKRIDKRTEQLEQVLEEEKKLAMADVDEQLLRNKNEVEEFEKLVDELVKGE